MATQMGKQISRWLWWAIIALALAACVAAPVAEPNVAPATNTTVAAATPPPLSQTPPPSDADDASAPRSPSGVILPTLTPSHQITTPVAVAPTATPLISATHPAAPTIHRVVSGDSLYAIARRYEVSLDELRAANNLTDDLIHPDQALIIPTANGDGVDSLTQAEDAPVTAPTQAAPRPYIFSPLYTNLADAYPARVEHERFTLHYTPDAPLAAAPETLAEMVGAALAHHESLLGVTLTQPIDVYAAGTLFAAPDQALRGRSFSVDRRTFFLADGSGNPTDLRYIAAHELTHVLTWNSFGQPSSVMLSEGVAVYAGMDWIAESDHLPLADFCFAYLQVGRLPRVSQTLDYLGHIRNLENYYAAGCFVAFLIERDGVAAFGRLYPTSDYLATYGKSLAELEMEWIADLAAHTSVRSFAAGDLVEAVETVEKAYDALFADFQGRSDELALYERVDAARLALLEGRLEDVQRLLEK